jgi:hypothetical protein
MFKCISFFLLFAFLLSKLIFAQPFAPVVPIPENTKNDRELAFGIKMIKDVQVPDRSEVGVIAYPGAKIVQTNKGREGMLPSVRLVSSDDKNAVIEFYKKKLKDWKNEDVYGTYMFWKSKDKTSALMGSEPVIQIDDGKKYAKLVAGTKTTILIGYKKK